ncbi:unnamed protein product [marine sediment metagenome]|uniref:SsuA/THI5-like domain-containing protein n=1 Tax=marine sediment metagenome TaxID=412755 RepID=X1PIR8_9ZZZZ
MAVIAGSADKTMVVAKDDKVKKRTIEWVGQIDYGPGHPVFVSAQRICEAITTASGGRLRLTVEPAADPMAIFDAVHQGDIDFGFSLSVYWTDKFPAAVIIFGDAHAWMAIAMVPTGVELGMVGDSCLIQPFLRQLLSKSQPA